MRVVEERAAGAAGDKEKILYLTLNMGAAGDMLAAALLDLMEEGEREAALAELNAAGIPKVKMEAVRAEKCGVVGRSFRVLIDGEMEDEHHHHHEHAHEHHHHHHATLDTVHEIIDQLALAEAVKEDVRAVYSLVAEAESAVHGRPVHEVHFHELGNLDAVADIATVCLLMRKIGAGRVMASPICVGSGEVHCAHGILPVPAPATALLLEGLPVYGGRERGELCTPTGAALLRHFVQEFAPLPLMRPLRYGYGMGKKDFSTANCVRATLGESL